MAVGEPVIRQENEIVQTRASDSETVRRTVAFAEAFRFWVKLGLYRLADRQAKNLTGALTGVTAAVVGVVLSLAIVFGAAVIWPRGVAQGPIGFPCRWGSVRSWRSTASRQTSCGWCLWVVLLVSRGRCWAGKCEAL